VANRYLLDTNIASYIIKGNVPAVLRRLMRVPMAEIAISAITEAELRYGVALKPGATHLQKVVEEFLLRVSILPWDSESAHQYEHLRSGLESSGLSMGNLDLMIAAHALALGAILVTNDQAFARIKKLKIEDWTK
jgi:tRNA(fMet)-specific endonuclease VapC